MYPYTEEVVLSGVKYKLWDLGGIKNHKIWKDYIYGADAIIYMIDASDYSRLK
jgi:GTPase SAR1 family protein